MAGGKKQMEFPQILLSDDLAAAAGDVSVSGCAFSPGMVCAVSGLGGIAGAGDKKKFMDSQWRLDRSGSVGGSDAFPVCQ